MALPPQSILQTCKYQMHRCLFFCCSVVIQPMPLEPKTILNLLSLPAVVLTMYGSDPCNFDSKVATCSFAKPKSLIL